MSFDGVIFRGLVRCVPWRHGTEVPRSWEEVCSSLAGAAKRALAPESGGHSPGHLCLRRTGLPVSALCGVAPGPSLKVSDDVPRASADGMSCCRLWRSSADTY